MAITLGTVRSTHYLELILAPLLAICAWISINPYFLWNSTRHMALAGMTTGVLAIAAFLFGDRPRRQEILGFALIVIFIFYISNLPNLDGTTTRWYFVLPTMLALAVFSDERRKQVIVFFTFIFSISLVPGIIASFCTITPININFEQMPLLNPVMAKEGGTYLYLPGALLLAGNQLTLPWGGELYRLCAMYDEPGMVGTIAAFLLASHRFEVNRASLIIVFTGGILSFSLAFIIMSALGFTARLFYTRSTSNLFPLAIVGLAGLLVVGLIKLPKPTPRALTENMRETLQPIASLDQEPEYLLKQPNTQKPETPVVLLAKPSSTEDNTLNYKQPQITTPPSADVIKNSQRLRSVENINNRSLPEMDRLAERYWNADFKNILLGLGANSSVVYGGVSQVATRLLTDFGLIGAILYASSLLALSLAITKNSQNPRWPLLFFILFALSVYQRPIIWMPYAFTLFICGPTFSGRQSTESR